MKWMEHFRSEAIEIVFNYLSLCQPHWWVCVCVLYVCCYRLFFDANPNCCVSSSVECWIIHHQERYRICLLSWSNKWSLMKIHANHIGSANRRLWPHPLFFLNTHKYNIYSMHCIPCLFQLSVCILFLFLSLNFT